MTAPPTAADLAAYLRIDDDTAGLADAVAVAVADQAARCDVSDYTAPLREAALRRAARVFTARAQPLGIELGDMGAYPLPRWDAEIETHEAAYRLAGFA